MRSRVDDGVDLTCRNLLAIAAMVPSLAAGMVAGSIELIDGFSGYRCIPQKKTSKGAGVQGPSRNLLIHRAAAFA
jgi:hypothetical protein